MREFATLRTLGASRRQIMRSVLLEGFALGVLASLLGLFGGVALAKGLSAVFDAIDVSMPQAGLVLATRTIIVSLVLGVGITMATIIPARRAMAIPPIAAVREGATLPAGRLTRHRWLPPVTAVAAIVLLVWGGVGGLDTGSSLLVTALGCLFMFVAFWLVSSRLVVPIASAVGQPSERIAGAAGRLALRNSQRNPVRTARTAAALMIGLTLVTLVATLGAGMRGTAEESLDNIVDADYVLTSAVGSGGGSPALSSRRIEVSVPTAHHECNQPAVALFVRRRPASGVRGQHHARVEPRPARVSRARPESRRGHVARLRPPPMLPELGVDAAQRWFARTQGAFIDDTSRSVGMVEPPDDSGVRPVVVQPRGGAPIRAVFDAGVASRRSHRRHRAHRQRARDQLDRVQLERGRQRRPRVRQRQRVHRGE